MLENEDEWEEVEEPSYAERPLAPFLSTTLPPPELRPTAPVVGPKFLLGGTLSHTSTQCAFPGSITATTPAAVVLVATPTMFAATPTVAVSAGATVAESLFPPVLFRQLFLRGSSKRQVGVLVVGYQQSIDEGKGRGGSRLSFIGRTIHASPGRFHRKDVRLPRLRPL